MSGGSLAENAASNPDSTSPRSVSDLISQKSAINASHVAAIDGSHTLAYRSLEVKSSDVARLLQQRGIGPGDRVPILTTRCFDMLICFLGVLKAGACYIPVDVEGWSIERIENTIETLDTRIILATQPVKIGAAYTSRLLYVSLNTLQDSQSGHPLQSVEHLPTDLAYIIFTSGTTSKAKGVMIPHSALFNYVQQGGPKTPFNMNVCQHDKVLLIFSVAFDACTGVIFSTLCNGGTLVLSQPATFIEDVAQCSILPTTPSILRTLPQSRSYDNIEQIYLGGESPTNELINHWHNVSRKIFNCYGPTETTCCSLIAELKPDRPIVLGVPMDNGEVFLIRQGDEITPLEGEICIGGESLAIGYWHDVELTRERFRCWNGKRYYRTGDYARQTSDGLMFLGRNDSMVKNKGFLVNIETQVTPLLQGYAKVQAATAIMHHDLLIGFICPEDLNAHSIRADLASKHESFLVPDRLVSKHCLPLTTNGKTDHEELLRMLVHGEEGIEVKDKSMGMDPLLRALLEATTEALELRMSDIDINMTFQEVGGGSLTAIRTLALLQAKHYSLSMSHLLGKHKLMEVARLLSPSRISNSSIPQISDDSNGPRHSLVPMTPFQSHLTRRVHQKDSKIVNRMLVTIDVDKNIDTLRLRKAWTQAFERHSIFAMGFDLSKGTLKAAGETVVDWQERQIIAHSQQSIVEDETRRFYTDSTVYRPEDLYKPMNRVRLIRIPGVGSRIIWLVPHILMDGWSMAILIQDVRAILAGTTLPTPTDFIEYATERAKLAESQTEASKAIWRKLLDDFVPPVSMTLPKPKVPGHPVQQQYCRKVGVSIHSLQTGAVKMQVSTSTIFYAAWALLLSRYASTDKVIFGITFSGRNFPMPMVERVVGPLVNICPFPIDVSRGDTKADCLMKIHESLFTICDHQWSTASALDEILECGQSFFYQTVVALQYDLPQMQTNFDTGPMWQVCYEDFTQFGLCLYIERDGIDLVAKLVYDTSLYSSQAVIQMASHFSRLVIGLIDPLCETISHVQEQMIESSSTYNSTKRRPTFYDQYIGPNTLQELFEQGVPNWADLSAVEIQNQTISYRELDTISNTVATSLREIVKPGDVVALLSDGSLNWIIGIFAIVKSEGTYCPIDIQFPRERVCFMVEKVKAVACLFPSAAYLKTHDYIEVARLCISEFSGSASIGPESPNKTMSCTRAAAYVIFTSGTTGAPKAIPISHEAILSYLDYPPARLHSCPGQRNAQSFAVGFDGSIAEVFGTLCYGATLVLKDMSQPFAHLRRVDAAMLTPSILSTFQPSQLPNLKTIFLGGEELPQTLVDAWSENRFVYNAYGPSECTVGCMFARMAARTPVTLGNPVPRMDVYVLDHRKRPVPIGVPGEIYVTGIQVAKGYIDEDEESRARFVEDLFDSNQVMFYTGDRGSWNDSGQIEYLGRADDQVKIRGYRVELKEVEQVVLNASAHVEQSAALLVNGRLICYVIPDTVDVVELRSTLQEKLPPHAIPSVIVPRKEFPVTANHKVDKLALSCLALPRTQIQFGLQPKTKFEDLVLDTWREATGFSSTSGIDLDENYMVLNGDSLRQIKAAQSLSMRLGYPIPVQVWLENTTLRSLAAAIEHHSSHLVVPTDISQSEPPSNSLSMVSELSPQEQEMYNLHTLSDNPAAWNIVCVLELSGTLDIDKLRRSIDATILEHEILRARYVRSGTSVHRRIENHLVPTVLYTQKDHTTANTFINEPFDLSRDQLFKAKIERRTGSALVTTVAHHIVIDKTSMDIVLRSISSKYQRLVNNLSICIKPSNEGLGYFEWVQWTKSWLVEKTNEVNLAYWKDLFRSSPPLPFSNGQNLVGNHRGSSLTHMFKLHESRTASLQYLLAIVTQAVWDTTSAKDLVIAVPYEDRSAPGAADVVGLFLDLIPLRISISDFEKARSASLEEFVSHALQQSVEHYVPISLIKQTIRVNMFDILVSFRPSHGALSKKLSLPNVLVKEQALRPEGARFPILLEFWETDQHSMQCNIEHNAKYIDSALIDKFLNRLGDHFSKLSSHNQDP